MNVVVPVSYEGDWLPLIVKWKTSFMVRMPKAWNLYPLDVVINNISIILYIQKSCANQHIIASTEHMYMLICQIMLRCDLWSHV